MNELVAILVVLVAVALVYEVARRAGVPYPALLVLGGGALALVPGLGGFELEPELILLVFLPPLLFAAAFVTPLRELRANIAPVARLAVGLVLFTMVVVAVVAQATIPGIGWAAALTLGAILAPTDAAAATTVFRRLGVPRLVVTLVEGEALLNDATALVLYRAGVVAVVFGGFAIGDAIVDFVIATIGGIAVGVVVGWLATQLLRRLDDPPVEVAISLVIPYAAYLPSDMLGLSGVLAVVATGLVIGRRLGTILTPSSRVLWLSTWKMIDFVLTGFLFVLIGLELPGVVDDALGRSAAEVVGLTILIAGAIIAARFIWVFAASMLPNSPRRVVARTDPRLARRLTFVVAWVGLRGAVSLAAALALPADFPERGLILVITFGVILITLIGQGLTLPTILRRIGWDGVDPSDDEMTVARAAVYQAGLDELERARTQWPDHGPLLERLESGLRDRSQHLATDDPEETAERRQEHLEHIEIQRGIITAERTVAIELRDSGQINDTTLRAIERDLDLEELRMEG